MKCVKCGYEIDPNSPFCGSCGASVEKPKSFCGGCGAELEGDTKFCGSCGNVSDNQITPVVGTSVASESIINKITEKIKTTLPFFKKHKFIIGGVLALLIILLSIYLGYQKFYDHTKLSWVETYGDYKTTHVIGGEISLKVSAYDKEEAAIKDIDFNVTGGEIVEDEDTVKWTLPSEPGTYKITASSPSGKKITKEITVLIDDINQILDNGLIEFDKNEEEELDSDQDGLTDIKEKELGTNPYLADSDSDGLLDKYEVEVSKTNPMNADSDSDGLSDGAEIELGTDPLKEDSKEDGIKDGDREFSYTIEKNGVTLVTTGNGNINNTTIDTSINTTFTKIDGISSKIYDFSTKGKLKSAKVTIKYNSEELEKNGILEDNLSIYYFDINTKKLEKVETKLDKQKKTVTATISHFSKYVLADNTKINVNSDTKVMFVIDNSVSMYSQNQMAELGYPSSTGAAGNDAEFKRLTLSNNLIDLFSDNYKVAIGSFAGSFYLESDFTNNKKSLKEAVNSIKNDMEKNISGTAIVNALNKSMEYFKTDDGSNEYIILMTDGAETQSSLSTQKPNIIESAKANGVKICVIGLGEVEDRILTEIAEETGCGFYYASNASSLDEIYKMLGSAINYDLVDTDGDGKLDSTITSDSGFIVTRDGFSFKNYGTVLNDKGHCYGMAAFAMLYYTDELPVSLGDINTYGLYFQRGTLFNIKATGYNLKNTYFYNFNETQKGNNLYDFKFTTGGLDIYLNKPEDFYNHIEDKVYYINETYYNSLKTLGTSFSLKKYNGQNKEFNKYQEALLNIVATEFKDNTTAEEYNLMMSIYRLAVLQAASDINSFTTNPDATYKLLDSNLEKEVPVVITILGSHAVNATRILRDNEDSNKFKIEVYDNNYPGEVRYIEVTRSKIVQKSILSAVSWNNEYQYKFSYGDKKDIRISVEILDVK